jgi:PAS domain S-box-containing protein
MRAPEATPDVASLVAALRTADAARILWALCLSALGFVAIGIVALALTQSQVGAPLDAWIRDAVWLLAVVWALAFVVTPYVLLRRAIAESAASEARARENARRFAVLSQAAFEAIVFTERGSVLDANDRFTDLVGYTRAELVGMTVAELVGPRWRAIVDARLRAQAEEPIEVELLHKDGSLIPIESRARKIPYEGRIVRVTAIRDMRDRKKAEQELKRSEELFRLAVEGAHMGIWVLDLRSDKVEHPSRIPWLYAPGDRPPATREEFLARIHPEDRARVAQAVADAITGRRPYDHVFRMLRPDGGVRWIEAKGKVFRDDDGTPAYMAGTALDVGERMISQERLRLSEERLRVLNADLERKVSERTAELAAANSELETFAYSVSHDLRAPLRAIHAFARALEEDHAASLGPDGTTWLHRIRDASERANDLIRSLLELSWVGRGELRRAALDLSELARFIGAEQARARPSPAVELVVEPDLRAEADRSLVRIALTNLLDNAWKFTSKTDAPRIEVGAIRSGPEAPVYFVRDNGAGFDPRFADKLFSPFQRLHAAREFPGTGIGLATVRRIVQRHGGRVWAEGAVDRGATFFFTLPAAQPASC